MDLLEVKKKGNYESVSRHPWELARVSMIKKLIKKNVSINDNSIVMDIGCGDSFVVEQLAEEYPNVSFYAVDIAFTEELINQYKKKLKVKNVFLHHSLNEFTSMPDIKVSLIILADVIEHIENDIKFISELLKEKFITSKTIFLITVPAFQSLFCSHDIFLGHYRRYTNSSLKKNLSAAGLNTLSNGYFFFCLIPIRILGVIKEKFTGFDVKKISTGLVDWDGRKTTSDFFKMILMIDARFSFALKKIGIKIPGLSNYAICKKTA